MERMYFDDRLNAVEIKLLKQAISGIMDQTDNAIAIRAWIKLMVILSRLEPAPDLPIDKTVGIA